MSQADKVILRHRALIESVNDELKKEQILSFFFCIAFTLDLHFVFCLSPPPC